MNTTAQIRETGIGAVNIQLAEFDGTAATALLTRQGTDVEAQLALPLTPGEPTTVSLEPGTYALAVTAPGRAPHREVINIRPCRVTDFLVNLSQHAKQQPSFAERLAKYGIDLNQIQVSELSVGERETVDLTDPDGPHRDAAQTVTFDRIDTIKAVFGVPDEYWPDGFSRYGEPADDIDGDSWRHRMREYVYGNSATVKGWQARLDEFISNDPLVVPVYVFQTVTVGLCATLRIGKGGLSCDLLRMHATARIKVVGGPAHVETSIYEGF